MTWRAVSPKKAQARNCSRRLQRGPSYHRTTMSRTCNIVHISDDIFAHILAFMRSPDILLCVPTPAQFVTSWAWFFTQYLAYVAQTGGSQQELGKSGALGSGGAAAVAVPSGDRNSAEVQAGASSVV